MSPPPASERTAPRTADQELDESIAEWRALQAGDRGASVTPVGQDERRQRGASMPSGQPRPLERRTGDTPALTAHHNLNATGKKREATTPANVVPIFAALREPSMPASPEIERSVLGALIRGADPGNLEPEDFFADDNRTTFMALCDLIQAGETVTFSVLADYMAAEGRMSSTLTKSWLSSRSDQGQFFDRVEPVHFEQLRRQRIKRQRIKAHSEAFKSMMGGDDEAKAEARYQKQLDEIPATAESVDRMAMRISDIDKAERMEPVAVLPRLAWAGKLTLLSAREKTGKSTLVSAAIAAMVRGDTWLGEATKPYPALWVSAEEDRGHIGRRAAVHGVPKDSRDFWLFDTVQAKPTPANIKKVAEHLEVGLIVMDALTSWCEVALGSVPDSGDAAGWQPVMTQLVDLARSTGAAVVVLHHEAKGSGEARDSTAIAAAADVLLNLRDATGNERILKAKGRISGLQGCKLHASGYEFRRWDVVSDRDDEEGQSETVDDRVAAYMVEHPDAKLTEIRHQVRGKASTIGEAFKRFKNDPTFSDRLL